MSRSLKLALFVLLLFFFARCATDNQPKGILSKQEMVGLLTDIQLIDGYLSALPNYKIDSLAPSLYLSVFKKHGTDSVRFSKSLAYYFKDPEDLEELYAQIKDKICRLEKIQGAIQAKKYKGKAFNGHGD